MKKEMTDAEVIEAFKSESLLNRARREFNIQSGQIEQAMLQRRQPTPIDVKRMEFEAVRKIAAVLGVKL